jgi:hypothetical protein
MRESKNTHNILVGNPHTRIPLRGSSSILENNVKMNAMEARCKDVTWMTWRRRLQTGFVSGLC